MNYDGRHNKVSESGESELINSYLNLFALVTNPPDKLLEKVEKVIISAFTFPKTLRYRNFYNVNTEF